MSDFNVPGSRPKNHDEISEIDRRATACVTGSKSLTHGRVPNEFWFREAIVLSIYISLSLYIYIYIYISIYTASDRIGCPLPPIEGRTLAGYRPKTIKIPELQSNYKNTHKQHGFELIEPPKRALLRCQNWIPGFLLKAHTLSKTCMSYKPVLLCFCTANLPTKSLDFRGLDSSRLWIQRGGNSHIHRIW